MDEPTIRERSGEVNTNNKLTVFLYILMRDYITPGAVEKIMREHVELQGKEAQLSNRWLGKHSLDIAERLSTDEDRFKSMRDISPLWLPVPQNLLPNIQGMPIEEKVELISNMADRFDIVPRDLTSTK